MDKYLIKLRRYNFKTIVEYISANEIKVKKSYKSQKLGDIIIISTDDQQDNFATRLKIMEDAIIYCKNKNRRKTISSVEFNELCKMRNIIYPIENEVYSNEYGMEFIFSMAKRQAVFNYSDFLSPGLSRDYYIFNEVDRILIKDPNKTLNIKEIINSLFHANLLDIIALIMLFYAKLIYDRNTIIRKPYKNYEKCFFELFDEYVTYNHGISKEFNKLKHGLLKIGDTYFVPFIGLLYNRLSNLIYWSIRDYCKEHYKKDFFPIRFGYYFEEYVNQYLIKSVGKKNFKRIDDLEKDGNRPDFFIERAGKEFIVECKSRLIFLEDIEKKLLDGYFIKELTKAVNQLREYKTEKKNAFRVLLLYEESFPLITYFEDTFKNKYNLNEYFFICTIDNFEALFDLNDDSDFIRILDKMILPKRKEKLNTLQGVLSKSKLGRRYSKIHLNYLKNDIKGNETKIVDFWNMYTKK